MDNSDIWQIIHCATAVATRETILFLSCYFDLSCIQFIRESEFLKLSYRYSKNWTQFCRSVNNVTTCNNLVESVFFTKKLDCNKSSWHAYTHHQLWQYVFLFLHFSTSKHDIILKCFDAESNSVLHQLQLIQWHMYVPISSPIPRCQ